MKADQTSSKLITVMSIIYKSQQQQHVNFNETAAESVQCCGEVATFRSEPSERSNNNDVLKQSTDSHLKNNNSNNNNRTYNYDEMVGTQQNLNQLQISSASSSALRDSNTSYANDLDAAKPSLSAQTESTSQHTFPVVIPYINSSYGSSAEMYNERKLHIKSSPDKVQDLSEYIRDHSKNTNLPSCTDGCVIPRSTNQGMFLYS